MIRAGDLRDRVTIERPATVQDEFGQPRDGWELVCEVWAQVLDLTGREFFAAQQVHSEVNSRIRLRYRTDIQPAMRGRCGNAVYDIKAVLDPEGLRRELHLMAVKEAVT